MTSVCKQHIPPSAGTPRGEKKDCGFEGRPAPAPRAEHANLRCRNKCGHRSRGPEGPRLFIHLGSCHQMSDSHPLAAGVGPRVKVPTDHEEEREVQLTCWFTGLTWERIRQRSVRNTKSKTRAKFNFPKRFPTTDPPSLRPPPHLSLPLPSLFLSSLSSLLSALPPEFYPSFLLFSFLSIPLLTFHITHKTPAHEQHIVHFMIIKQFPRASLIYNYTMVPLF